VSSSGNDDLDRCAPAIKAQRSRPDARSRMKVDPLGLEVEARTNSLRDVIDGQLANPRNRSDEVPEQGVELVKRL
jgi:hypothetical protein